MSDSDDIYKGDETLEHKHLQRWARKEPGVLPAIQWGVRESDGPLVSNLSKAGEGFIGNIEKVNLYAVKQDHDDEYVAVIYEEDEKYVGWVFEVETEAGATFSFRFNACTLGNLAWQAQQVGMLLSDWDKDLISDVPEMMKSKVGG